MAEAKARKTQRKIANVQAKSKIKAKNVIYTRLADSRKLTRNTKDTIRQIFQGAFKNEIASSRRWHSMEESSPIPKSHRLWQVITIYNRLKTSLPAVSAGKQLLLSLENCRSKLLEAGSDGTSPYAHGIVNLAWHQSSWLRTPETWKCRHKNKNRQFASLIRHLLGTYDVPSFMDKAWLVSPGHLNVVSGNGASAHRSWWLWVAKGNNIRKAPNLPIPLTKKMAHHFLRAPTSYAVEEALRWGQIHALGGNERNVMGVLTTFLRSDFANNDFWTSVIRFFLANPMLDTFQYNPIADYLRNQKYIAARGEQPPQPHLSMHGRTAEALLTQVESWHRRLGRFKRKKGPQDWEHHPDIADFIHQERKKINNAYVNIDYAITQLLTSQELKEEGRKLEHCVGSYSWSCIRGQRSIWSIRKVTASGYTSMGTIEMDNKSRRVSQFSAKRNRRPDPKARFLLEQWAQINKISISRWV